MKNLVQQIREDARLIASQWDRRHPGAVNLDAPEVHLWPAEDGGAFGVRVMFERFCPVAGPDGRLGREMQADVLTVTGRHDSITDRLHLSCPGSGTVVEIDLRPYREAWEALARSRGPVPNVDYPAGDSDATQGNL